MWGHVSMASVTTAADTAANNAPDIPVRHQVVRAVTVRRDIAARTTEGRASACIRPKTRASARRAAFDGADEKVAAVNECRERAGSAANHARMRSCSSGVAAPARYRSSKSTGSRSSNGFMPGEHTKRQNPSLPQTPGISLARSVSRGRSSGGRYSVILMFLFGVAKIRRSTRHERLERTAQLDLHGIHRRPQCRGDFGVAQPAKPAHCHDRATMLRQGVDDSA